MKCSQDPHCQVDRGQSIWVTVATGANYLDISFIGDVLPDIILHHLQFTDQVSEEARRVLNSAATLRNVDIDTQFMVAIHIRRTDYKQFSKFWLPDLLNETYYIGAMEYMRNKYQNVTFLVVSDDTEWARAHLLSEDVIIVTCHSPAVDMAIMANSNATIVDYGTYSVWGGILNPGEVVISNKTFGDSYVAAKYFGWTYI